MSPGEYLQGQLERLFELDGMMALSSELLGVEPAELGGTGTKGTFARALVRHCETHDELEVLAEAIRLSANDQGLSEPPPSTDDELPIGAEVRDARVLELMERGPLAAVYLVEREGGERAHLKVFRRELTRDRIAAFRLLTAVRALREARDVGLVSLLDAGTLGDGRAFLLTQAVRGQTLATRIARTGALSLSELQPLLRPLLRALAGLHARGLHHGMIAAEQVVLVQPPPSETGERSPAHAALDGLAFAKLLEGDSDVPHVLRMVGEFGALAPELTRGQRAGKASDIYALGCLLYHALTGSTVFEGAHAIDKVIAHVQEEPVAPSERNPEAGIGADLDAVILRALAKDPSERFADVGELLAALDAEVRSSVPPAPSHDVSQVIEALRAAPGDVALATELEALIDPGDGARVAVSLYRELAAESEDEAVKKQLLFRAARLLRVEVGDDALLAEVYEEILALDPADLAAHEALAELHRARGAHEALIAVLLDRLDLESDSSRRAALLREVAERYEDGLAQPESALVAYTQALCDQPDDAASRRAIERLAAEPAQLQEVLASLHERLADEELSETQRSRLSLRVGGWCLDRLAQPETARPYLEQAARLAPSDPEVLDALSRLYRQTGSHAELLGVTLERAKHADSPTARRMLMAEAAGIAHVQLNDLALAEHHYAAVFADDPSHLEAAQALEEIYADTGDREKLITLLERRLAEHEGPARAEALCELALLHEDDADRASTLYEQALAVDPTCLAAYAGLADLHAARGDQPALRALLRRELEVASAVQQRIALLERIARVSDEALSDTAAAVESYEAIIALEPGHELANTALARLYRGLHRFEDQVATYDRHAKSLDDDQRKIELLMQAARVAMVDLARPEETALFCERVLAMVPTHAEALALSARLKAHAGEHFAAVDALDVLADTEIDAEKRADLLVRAGMLLESEQDLEAASQRYARALYAMPAHAPTLDALARLHAQRGDVQGEADLLAHRAGLADQPAARASLLATLGNLRKDKLGDRAGALDAFRRAYEADDASHEARIGLGQLALEQSRWEEAVLLLAPVLAEPAGLDAEVALPLFKGLGAAYQALGQPEGAEQAYRAARALDENDLALVERLADLALAAERWDDASALLETLLAGPTLASLDDELTPVGYAEQPSLWQRLGHARFKRGDLAGAASALDTAQELDPEDDETLVALADVQTQQGDHAGLALTLQRRLELPLDDQTRLALLTQAGDLASQGGQHLKASALYGEALELDADDRNLLTKLMSAYSALRDWPHLIEVLVRMASVVDDEALAAKYLSTAGGIALSELGDVDAASVHFERALDLDPDLEGALRGLVNGLTRAGAWDKLATAYRAQIDRQAARARPAAELVALWDALGAIYKDRLHRLEPAIEAHEAASALAPEQSDRLEQLVELYGRVPTRFPERAVAAHEQWLASDALRVSSYRALRKLYTQLSRPDEAWTVCQALRSLGVAEPEEEAFFRRHRVQAPVTARECITEEMWQELVLSPEQDPTVTRLLALIQPAAMQVLAQPHEAFGATREQPIDVQTDDAVMARMIHYAGGVLLVPVPQVFRRPSDVGGVSFLFTNPPALGLGQGALHGDAPDQALAFLAGRQLSYFRPAHYLRQLLPTGSGLRTWVLGAIRQAQPRFPVPEALRAQVERCSDALARTLNVPQQQALVSLVEQLLREQPELDLKRWSLAVDLAADRAGFILANSLDAAVAVIRASPQDSSAASERERLKALYQYAVSGRYHALRKAIGVTIG
ncbi:MAG: hypothetical protein ABW252_20710 [Polyangiales bacterium]